MRRARTEADKRRIFNLVSVGVALASSDDQRFLAPDTYSSDSDYVPLLRVFDCQVEPAFVRALMHIKFGSSSSSSTNSNLSSEDLAQVQQATQHCEGLDDGRLHRFLCTMAEVVLTMDGAAERAYQVALTVGKQRPLTLVRAFSHTIAGKVCGSSGDDRRHLLAIIRCYWLFRTMEVVVVDMLAKDSGAEQDLKEMQNNLVQLAKLIRPEIVPLRLPLLYTWHLLRLVDLDSS